ncbi:hypothetical protein NL676_023837 [Syzygium grande]|nr:hypothetical protein NL676_023837 [Syzygium grande]
MCSALRLASRHAGARAPLGNEVARCPRATSVRLHEQAASGRARSVCSRRPASNSDALASNTASAPPASSMPTP